MGLMITRGHIVKQHIKERVISFHYEKKRDLKVLICDCRRNKKKYAIMLLGQPVEFITTGGYRNAAAARFQ